MLSRRKYKILATIFAPVLAPALTITFALPQNAVAEPILGFSFGADFYSAAIQGDISSIAQAPTDDQTDVLAPSRLTPFALGITDPVQIGFYAAFEHELPLIPQAKISYINFDYNGDFTTTQDLVFVGSTLAAATEASSSIAMSMLDLQLYYPVIDSWVYLDLGINVKSTNTEISLTPVADPDDTGGTDGTTEPISPITSSDSSSDVMLASNFGVRVPESLLYFGGTFNYWENDESKVSDLNFFTKLQFDRSSTSLVFEAGYRKHLLTASGDNLNLDVKIGGPYLSLAFAF